MHLRQHPQPTKLALLGALPYEREREVTDSLAQVPVSTVHRIDAHAEEKVIAELVKEFKRVPLASTQQVEDLSAVRLGQVSLGVDALISPIGDM